MGTKHFPEPKTLPRESKTTSQNPKHVPESKNTSQNPKHIPESKIISKNPKHIWILGSVFEFWEVFLDSGKCFWIPGKCFWIPGTCFVPYEPPYYLEDVDQQARKRREVSNRTQVTWISQSKAKSKLMYLGRRDRFCLDFVSDREKFRILILKLQILIFHWKVSCLIIISRKLTE